MKYTDWSNNDRSEQFALNYASCINTLKFYIHIKDYK
jgi:hypothetical protein